MTHTDRSEDHPHQQRPLLPAGFGAVLALLTGAAPWIALAVMSLVGSPRP